MIKSLTISYYSNETKWAIRQQFVYNMFLADFLPSSKVIDGDMELLLKFIIITYENLPEYIGYIQCTIKCFFAH